MLLQLYLDYVEYTTVLSQPEAFQLFMQIACLFFIGILGGYIIKGIMK